MNTQLYFLLYDSRSGSTYLSALLNRYKGISVSLESAFVSHIIEYPGPVNRQNLDAIFEYLQQEIQFRELGLDIEALKKSLSTENDLNKKRLAEAIIEHYFSRRDAQAECLIVKHAPYAYLSEIVKMFPEVRFLQIIRDGRAVFNSKKKTTSLKGHKMAINPLKAAWDWRLKLQRAEKYKTRTVNILYEELIRKQEETLQNILEKLSISDEGRRSTKQQSDYFLNIGEAQKGLHKNVSKSPQTDVIDKWKQQLSDREIRVYNFINQDYLEKYGYKMEQPITKSSIILYGFYLTKFGAEKVKNILFLLRKPSLLKLKFRRNYNLLRSDNNVNAK